MVGAGVTICFRKLRFSSEPPPGDLDLTKRVAALIDRPVLIDRPARFRLWDANLDRETGRTESASALCAFGQGQYQTSDLDPVELNVADDALLRRLIVVVHSCRKRDHVSLFDFKVLLAGRVDARLGDNLPAVRIVAMHREHHVAEERHCCVSGRRKWSLRRRDRVATSHRRKLAGLPGSLPLAVPLTAGDHLVFAYTTTIYHLAIFGSIVRFTFKVIDLPYCSVEVECLLRLYVRMSSQSPSYSQH